MSDIRLIATPAGLVEDMPVEQYLEMGARGQIKRWWNEKDWLASLDPEYFETRLQQFFQTPHEGIDPVTLRPRRDVPDLIEVVERERRFEGVYDRSYASTHFGKPSLRDGMLMYKGGEIMWRLLRGDTEATNLKAFGGNAPANDAENSITYTSGNNNLTHMDIGTDATALTDPGDRSRNTLRTPGSSARKVMDSTYWKIKTVSNTPVTGSRIAQFLTTFASSEMNNAWQEFGIFNSATRTATWNDFANTMLDIFTSNQGTKASGQTWAITVEFTLA